MRPVSSISICFLRVVVLVLAVTPLMILAAPLSSSDLTSIHHPSPQWKRGSLSSSFSKLVNKLFKSRPPPSSAATTATVTAAAVSDLSPKNLLSMSDSDLQSLDNLAQSNNGVAESLHDAALAVDPQTLQSTSAGTDLADFVEKWRDWTPSSNPSTAMKSTSAAAAVKKPPPAAVKPPPSSSAAGTVVSNNNVNPSLLESDLTSKKLMAMSDADLKTLDTLAQSNTAVAQALQKAAQNVPDATLQGAAYTYLEDFVEKWRDWAPSSS